jgi:PqqD family protein of HPr-rel-A system
LSSENKMKICPDVVWRPVEGDSVLFHSRTGLYYGLNGVAAEIWRMLAAGDTEPTIVQALQSRYDVDMARAAAEVQQLTTALLRSGLIVENS